jgi:hypothetical protein
MITPMMVLAMLAASASPPLIRLDLAQDGRAIVVDREAKQYLGHVSTVMLEDGKTILAVYPKGHGGGEIVLKRSTDAGLTWSDRLPTPSSWATSKECPSIHRTVDAKGVKRLILWTGLFPARFSISEDDGTTWSELASATPPGETEWGGIVVMSAVDRTGQPGEYTAWFHDDGRFFRKNGKVTPTFTLFQTRSTDGGLNWAAPEPIFASDKVSLCEPGVIRSPDGKQLAMLLREESRRKRSHIMFSDDEGRTWSAPKELPLALTGDKHTLRYAKDGRLLVSFRDHTVKGSITGDTDPATIPGASPTEGDWMLWVGTYQDLVSGGDGQLIVRLMDNTKAWDCAYPGLEVAADGTIVVTTYGHWDRGKPPFIACVRLTTDELDKLAKNQPR